MKANSLKRAKGYVEAERKAEVSRARTRYYIMRKPFFASPFGRACFSVAIKTAYLYLTNTG